mmetsp:Transcript_17635/g.70811  ORF Transcript_17635/g.70811 Transcript_17635/m.70811 type:complete len:223 (-) Transcript_17635:85-753(-)
MRPPFCARRHRGAGAASRAAARAATSPPTSGLTSTRGSRPTRRRSIEAWSARTGGASTSTNPRGSAPSTTRGRRSVASTRRASTACSASTRQISTRSARNAAARTSAKRTARRRARCGASTPRSRRCDETPRPRRGRPLQPMLAVSPPLDRRRRLSPHRSRPLKELSRNLLLSKRTTTTTTPRSHRNRNRHSCCPWAEQEAACSPSHATRDDSRHHRDAECS